MEATRTKSVRLRDTLLGITDFSIYKNKKIMDLKQKSKGILEIRYEEKENEYEGIWYLETNKIVKTKGNIKTKQMIDVLISNFLINREERIVQTAMEKIEKQRASL